MDSSGGSWPCLIWIFTLLILLTTALTAEEQVTRDFCVRNDIGQIDCRPNQIILVDSANFGRMRKTSRCISQDYGTRNCFTGVTKHMQQLCSGKYNCTFNVKDFIDLVQPCPMDLMSYLEVTHRCVPVSRLPPHNCDQELTPKASQGYIIADTRTLSNQHLRTCTLRVRVETAQRLQIHHVLFDAQDSTVGGTGEAGTGCVPAKVQFREADGGPTSTIDLCRSTERFNPVYTSRSNIVEMKMVGGGSYLTPDYAGGPLFQFRVIGCPAIKPPSGGFVQIEDETAKVQCNSSKETWYLSCQENEWIGEYGNCSAGAHQNHEGIVSDEPFMFPQGLLIAIFLGVIIGVALGLAMLGLVYICFKNKRRNGQYEDPNLALDYVHDATDKDAYASMMRQHHQQQQQQQSRECTLKPPDYTTYRTTPEPVDVLVCTRSTPSMRQHDSKVGMSTFVTTTTARSISTDASCVASTAGQSGANRPGQCPAHSSFYDIEACTITPPCLSQQS